MNSVVSRTSAGAAATEVILEVFRANGAFVIAGGHLAALEGLTSSRWQVLGAVALAGRPLTVPQIARRMGLTRQSVQASANQLLEEGLVEAAANPDHRRSPLMRLTGRGHSTYARLDRRQADWVNELATGISVEELATTARILRRLSDRLGTTDPRHREDP